MTEQYLPDMGESMCRVTGEHCDNSCPGEPVPCPECCTWMCGEVERLQGEVKELVDLANQAQRFGLILKRSQGGMQFVAQPGCSLCRARRAPPKQDGPTP